MRKLRIPGPVPYRRKGLKPGRAISFIGWFIVLTSLFALAYNQAPLFTSNQNQYFLHGYAQAGVGTLAEDWLANTADPTPVFSLLVQVTVRLFPDGSPFYLFYAFLMGIYFFSLYGSVAQVFPIRSTAGTRLAFIAAIILLHSTVLRYLLLRLAGPDWSYIFEGGLAGQRLLGTVFQPSTFGVFLLLSIYLYLRDRKSLAVLSAVLAATFHPTYLLSAAALTLAYLVDTVRMQKKPEQAIRLGLLALAAVSPIALYTLMKFWGRNPAIDASARELLVTLRLPVHALASYWFNAPAVVTMSLMVVGLVLIRRHRLFWILLVPLALGVVLTITQIVLKNDTLALLFPWRISTWLLPVSVGMMAGRLATVRYPPLKPVFMKVISALGLITIGMATAAGMVRTYLESMDAAGLPFRPVEAYVATHRLPGEQYLVPFKIYDFRLETGAPSYMDFLAIPYKSEEVMEWYRRFSLANLFFQRAECNQLSRLSRERVTHVIVPLDFHQECPVLVEVYADDAYRLFELTP
jgi:hypothetical protein